ncbi:MAG: alpha-amylase [Treponema sp.]|nr:alpha-amylase [Treponema sp.]
MKISHNEFHISKKIRDLCNFDSGLFASSGNVVFANMKNVRAFQLLINNVFESRGEENKKLSAGQLNAMGLIDEILHYVCMLYRRDKVLTFMDDLLASLDKEFGRDSVDGLLLDFIREFPPVAVYKEKIRPEEYLAATELDAGTGVERTNRAQTLEELVLLHLANENKAFEPFMIMFSDKELAKNKLYEKSWKSIQKYAASQPVFGPFNHDLITLLREPQVFAPDSLRGQLEYLQKYWDKFLGEWLKRILAGMDTISEEEKAAWHGFGGGELPDMQPYSFENLMNEYERFSADSEWMPNVILMAKTVLVWLDQLTKQYGYPITRLDQIPDAELDRLRDEGFTGLWLIGLWSRSEASKRIKQLCGNPEAAASAYSLYDYNIAENIGGWDALNNLRARLWQRGIRLASDMVPNHTGMDGEWVMNHPDYFVQRRDPPSYKYTFNGENLSHDPRTSVYLEDHYYSKEDCSVVFKRVDNQTGDTRYIYHGNDGTGLPWNDTAQIDFLNPAAREAVMQEILHVAHNFPIIRFDAAMVLAKKSIRRLWYPEPGHGGDIYSRSEYSMSTQQFNDAIPNEFWREVVDRVAQECPDTLLLAEAFWMMEGYFVRTLGMHRVYNSAFMNMLKKEENQKYRDTIKNTITFDPQVLKRYVNFMNNPDEETAIAQFGDGDKYFGVCTLMITMPGLPMFGHGQIEGFTEKYGMEYTKAYKDEKPSQYLVDRHWHDIFPLMKKRYLFSGVDNFLLYDLWEDGHVNENVFCYSNGAGNERAIVFYNNKYDQAHGWIKQSDPYAVKTGKGDEVVMKSRSISEGLNLTAEDDKYCIFQEHRSRLWFVRKSSEICEKGMFVMLNGFEYQVYLNVHQVSDQADHRYKILCEYLNGRGCEDIETAWQEIIYKDLYAALHKYASKIMGRLFGEFGYEKIKPILDTSAENTDDAKVSAAAKKSTAAKKPAEISVKKLTAALEDAAEEAEEFFTAAAKFADPKLKLDAKKELSEVAVRIKKLAQIHNENLSKKTKAPTDLQKALLKASAPSEKNNNVITFATLMENADARLEKTLLCWALTGSLAEKGLGEKFALGRKLNEYLRDEKLSKDDERMNLTKLFILAAAPAEDPYAITKLLMSGKYSALLSGANCFDKIWWFNKEVSDDSLNKLTLLALLASKPAKTADIFKLYKTLCAAKTKAAYKCENLLKEFAPKESTKKKTVKKSAKKPTRESKKN